MNLSFEDEDHLVGRRTLLKENISGIAEKLLSVAREPKSVFEGQAMQRPNALQSLGDLFDGSRSSGGGNGWGKHPVTSGLTDSE
jgi:hypothetical protein